MSMYIMKPWYKTKETGKTTTFRTTTEFMEQRVIVSQTANSTSTGDTVTLTSLKPVVYNRIYSRYDSNSLSSSSSTFTKSSALYFMNSSYTTTYRTVATVTKPYVPKVLREAYSSKISSTTSWYATAKKYLLESTGTTSTSYKFISSKNGTVNSSGSVSMKLTVASDTITNSKWFGMGILSTDNLIENETAGVSPDDNIYFANYLVSKLTSYNIVSGRGTLTVSANSSSTKSCDIIYPAIFVNYSDPSQIRQLITSSKSGSTQYIMLQGTLSRTT